jgi:hypothetical protein
MTATKFGGFRVVTDETVKPNTFEVRDDSGKREAFDFDGVRLCAACGCREDVHCLKCGCLTNKGERDECICARFVAVIWACPDCGHMFSAKWKLQNHRLPVPTCRAGARGAAGRFADTPSAAPPLQANRDKYVAGAR